jgi:hypothetical protein
MLGGNSLTIRISFSLAAILIVAALLTAGLNYFKFDRALRDVQSGRYAFVVGDLRGTIEQSVNLGLPVAGLRNLQLLIERRKAQDPSIAEIAVFDGSGEVLFDTARGRAGMRVPPNWLAGAKSAQDFRLEDRDAGIVGARLTNSFGEAIGGIVLRYQRDGAEGKTTSALFALARATLIAAGMAVALCLAGSIWIMRGLRHRLDSISAALDEAVADANDAAQMPGFAGAAGRALGEVARAEREIERLASG